MNDFHPRSAHLTRVGVDFHPGGRYLPQDDPEVGVRLVMGTEGHSIRPLDDEDHSRSLAFECCSRQLPEMPPSAFCHRIRKAAYATLNQSHRFDLYQAGTPDPIGLQEEVQPALAVGDLAPGNGVPLELLQSSRLDRLCEQVVGQPSVNGDQSMGQANHEQVIVRDPVWTFRLGQKNQAVGG